MKTSTLILLCLNGFGAGFSVKNRGLEYFAISSMLTSPLNVRSGKVDFVSCQSTNALNPKII